MVHRLRLFEQLNRGLNYKLTVVAAPAGFGKTTVVSGWLNRLNRPVAWLALDELDNEPHRFFSYLLAALQPIAPTAGQVTQEMLAQSQLPPPEILLTPLLNELTAIPTGLTLVLDDYHTLDAPIIHQALNFLLDHAPARFHLVIISRAEPPLNLARWRGRGQLVELTSADLRFTAAEVEAFLTGPMQLKLSAAERAALEMRTEGWVAGLQLAGLSLQGQDNPAAFIDALSGSDRYIGDYLFAEVLRHQPEDVQQFLLATAVVDSLCADLGNVLLERRDSQAMLEYLERHQLFIVPLDNQRRWYRYHPLFADLLRQQLAQTTPEQPPRLHRRASRWFEQQQRLAEAIQHSLAALDFERAAELVEMAFQPGGWVQHGMHRLLNWFEALPERVVRHRPKLQLAYAWLLLELYADEWPRIETHLQRVEALLTAPDAAVFTPVEVASLLAQVDLLRANHARHSGNPAQVIALCQQALERLPTEHTYLRSGIIAHLATAYEDQGDMTRAASLYVDSINVSRIARNIDGWLFAAARLIEVYHQTGELRQAEHVFAAALAGANQRRGPDVGRLHIAIGDIYRQQNRLELAQTHLEMGLELCRPFEAWHDGVVSGVISLAMLLAAGGQFDRAEQMVASLRMPLPQQAQARLAATSARLRLAQGDIEAAARWARRRGLSPTDPLTYPREAEYLTLARLQLTEAELAAQGIRPSGRTTEALAQAESLVDRLYETAFAGGRLARVIEIRLLQTRAHLLRQDHVAAQRALTEALDLAEPAGFIRLLADEGAALAQWVAWLRPNLAATIAPDFLETVLAALTPVGHTPLPAGLLAGDTLTAREQATLALLAAGLTIEEIARELTVSVSTVRTYAKRIYSKLDVHSRAEAVYRAKALHLL